MQIKGESKKHSIKSKRTRTICILNILLLTVLLSQGAVYAQDSIYAWKKSLIFDLTTTQTTYSDSWIGGEAGSVNWVTNLYGSAEKQLNDWNHLKTTLKLSFGQTMSQDTANNWSKPKKSTDKIDWETVSSFTLHKFVDPYAAFRLESQFYDGSNPAKKLFFSPMLLTESFGITRHFVKTEKEEVISRLGFGFRQLIRSVIIDTLLNSESESETDGGIESVSDATLTLHKKIKYIGKLTLFKALFFSKSDEPGVNDDWKAIDVNWENTLSAAVSKVITVNLYAQLLYDKEITSKTRIKETMSLGLVFNLI